MRAAVLRYRVMAYVTGVMLIILCFVGIPLQIAGHAAVADIVGDLHGFCTWSTWCSRGWPASCT